MWVHFENMLLQDIQNMFLYHAVSQQSYLSDLQDYQKSLYNPFSHMSKGLNGVSVLLCNTLRVPLPQIIISSTLYHASTTHGTVILTIQIKNLPSSL